MMLKRRWRYSAWNISQRGNIFNSLLVFAHYYRLTGVYFTPRIPIRNKTWNPRILIIAFPPSLLLRDNALSLVARHVRAYYFRRGGGGKTLVLQESIAGDSEIKTARNLPATKRSRITRDEASNDTKKSPFSADPSSLRRHDANEVERISRSVCESPAVGPPARPPVSPPRGTSVPPRLTIPVVARP